MMPGIALSSAPEMNICQVNPSADMPSKAISASAYTARPLTMAVMMAR